MSAQQRYSTLVKHICQIYSAEDGGVAELTAGLHDILARVNPVGPADWKKVQADSKRLLRVWHARADDDDAAADEVVDQIAESLKEFAVGEVQLVADKPTLVVSEVAAPAAAAAPVYKTVVVEAEADEDEEDEEEEEEVVVVVKKAAEAEAEADDEESVVEPAHDEEDIKMIIEEAPGKPMDIEEEDEEMELEGGGAPMDECEFEEAVAAAEAEEEEEAEAAEAVVEEGKQAEEANAEAEAEESDDDEEAEEAEEEEEEAEEEEGLEVEKRVIRGRPYWVDVNTNKLYAVVGDDDVGDEVGAIINGKPVMKAA